MTSVNSDALNALNGPGGAVATTAVALEQVIQLCELNKWIDQRPVLRRISLEVPRGQFTALLGANGAGKSTLLRILATLLKPSSGQAFLFSQPLGRDTPSLRARIGLVSHQSMLYRDLSARENLEFFGKLYGVADPRQRASQLLGAVGLLDRADDAVGGFSRGMAQRVSIARALVHDPELIFADEPFAGLDAPSTRAVEVLLGRLHQLGKTVVLVNHDIEQTLRLVQRVIVLHKGAVAMDQPAGAVSGGRILELVSAG